MSKKPILTEVELISILKKTSSPTILVEGSDDFTAYRYIQKKIAVENVDVLPCGSRSMLLKIFQRRQEFKSSQVVFVADRDMWLFTQIPPEYKEGIIFTNSYSLENDLYIQDLLEGLLEARELQDFQALIGKTIHGPSEARIYLRHSCASSVISNGTLNSLVRT